MQVLCFFFFASLLLGISTALILAISSQKEMQVTFTKLYSFTVAPIEQMNVMCLSLINDKHMFLIFKCLPSE